jgi:hypothetical protein
MPNDHIAIVGADAVAAALGGWPSFHDAEIIRVCVERNGVSTVAVQLCVPGRGCDDGRVITFAIERIKDLALDGEDINRQNVIACLTVEQTDRGIKLTFSPCYGLAGQITAEKVSVRVD